MVTPITKGYLNVGEQTSCEAPQVSLRTFQYCGSNCEHWMLVWPQGQHFREASSKNVCSGFSTMPRLLPICCSKIENTCNVESDIAININILCHILISWCHVVLNLNFFLFCFSDWQKLLWRFVLVWSEHVMESLPLNNFVKHSLYIVML